MRNKQHLAGYAALLGLALASAGCAHHEPPARSAANDACSTARQASAGAELRLPFEVVDGRVYVPVRVNGLGPYTFAIDTGASGFGRADASLTAALGLQVSGATENSDGVSTATAQTVHLDSLRFGDLERQNLDVISRDYSSRLPEANRISGILGREFFADGLLVIDFPSRTVSFTRTSALRADNAGVLAYERPFRVPVTIGDLSTTANLDTGADVSLVLPLSTYQQLEAGPLQDANPGRLTNTTIENQRGVVRGPVRLGEATVSDIEVVVSDRYPEVLVGGDVLQNYVIAFDQRSRLVAVCAQQG